MSHEHETDPERRKALAKLGSLAALSGPAVTTLLVSNRATAQSVTFGGGDIPASVITDPNDPNDTEVCIGGGGTCP